MKTLKLTSTRVLLLAALLAASAFYPSAAEKPEEPIANTANRGAAVYQNLHLGSLGLSAAAYDVAVKGWEKLKANGIVKTSILAICDFSQSSNNKRLYIIDMENGTLLFNSLVAHGKNTGEEFAKYFSNQPQSLQTSLGFYATKSTYQGGHGLSLKLSGLEKGFNDKAEERAIVMHGANYVCNSFCEQEGRLGRSWGCPAVSYEEHAEIINTLKDGSCLFIYYPDKTYLASSKLVR